MPQTRGQKRKIAALQRLVTLHGMEEDSIQFAATTLSLTYNEMCTERRQASNGGRPGSKEGSRKGSSKGTMKGSN